MMGILSFKVALCLGYLRILSMGQNGYRFIVWVTLVTCVLFHLAGTLVLILNCHPVRTLSFFPQRPSPDYHLVLTSPGKEIMAAIDSRHLSQVRPYKLWSCILDHFFRCHYLSPTDPVLTLPPDE